MPSRDDIRMTTGRLPPPAAGKARVDTGGVTEFELKFQVPRERAAAVQAALQRGAVERTRLRARPYDPYTVVKR